MTTQDFSELLLRKVTKAIDDAPRYPEGTGVRLGR